MKLCIHFFTPVARLATDSAFFRIFDLRKAWCGILVFTLALFLLAAPVAVIAGVFSSAAGYIMLASLFSTLIFLAFLGAASAVGVEILEKAARRPPQTTEFENDLAPRLVSYFSISTSPDLRPPKTSTSRNNSPEVEVAK